MIRAEQKATSPGGKKNLGSNRNAEGTRKVTNRERVGHIVVEAHGFPILMSPKTSAYENMSKAFSNPKVKAERET